jgi:VanZ family protein
MGKAQVRVIVVRKWATGALLVLASAALLGLALFLSGKAYSNDRPPAELIALAIARWNQGPERFTRLIATLMPAIANAGLFVPWGFLAFLLIDRNERSRIRTYLITAIGALLFALAVIAWQSVLPTHVTSWFDSVWNVAGALAGAALGHLRKALRIRFE